jgi:alpha/beta superfamily hydrolase
MARGYDVTPMLLQPSPWRERMRRSRLGAVGPVGEWAEQKGTGTSMIAAGSPPESQAVMVRDDGGTEEVAFLGDEALLFGCLHIPAGEVRGGLVICSPILADFGANYQREVNLARHLAADGVAVQRFHPRGTGHSDGDAADLTLQSLIDDATQAFAHLRDRLPGRTIAVLGTRFSALVATRVAGAHGQPLVLWEPVTDPQRYIKEGLRARAVNAMRSGVQPEEPADELARRGFVDLLGIPVGRELLGTASDVGLAAELGEQPCPVLLVQLDQRDELRDDYVALREQLQSRRCDVTAHCFPLAESWWFVHDRLAPTEAVVEATVRWLLARL